MTSTIIQCSKPVAHRAAFAYYARLFFGGGAERDLIMQAEIHPKYGEITATCSCGNVVITRSTLCRDIHIDVCSQCHPFFTGKQKIVDSGGRVDRFNKRFGKRGAAD